MGQTLDIGSGYTGDAWFFDAATHFGAQSFLVKQVIAGKSFAALVQVQSVSAGGVGLVGTVSVQPMVNQVDGLGNQVPHGTIYSLPYFRLQGGASAVIMDPSEGDIGLAVICDRDISTVKATRAVSGPGSRRRNDWGDGLYLGGFLNGTPTTYVDLTGGSVAVVTPGNVTIQAANATLDASGNLAVNGDVTMFAGTPQQVGGGTHKHTVGSPDTSAPIAGT
jgi:hypothetical protein